MHNKKNSFEIQLSPIKLPESMDDAQTLDDASEKSGNIIEDILDRIGLGKFHYLTYSIIGIYWLIDGAEIIALSLLNYVLVHVYWFRSLQEVSMLGSCLFGGYFVGSLIAGPITNRFGRRRPFLVYMVLIFIFGLMSAFSPNFHFLLASRSCYGVLVGILSPLTSSMITEITPRSKRGINFIIVSALFTFGEAIAVFVGAMLQIEQPGSQSWRFLFIWVSLPALVALALGYKYLEESPRYHLINNPDEGMRVLGHMYRLNKKADLELTEDEHQQVQDYIKAQKAKRTSSPIKEIFSKDNLRITINLWIAWWVLNFVYYGIVYVLPLVIARISKGSKTEDKSDDIDYFDILVSISAEFPSYIFGGLLIENKTFGRKPSLAMSFGITAMFCFGAHFFVDSAFLICVFFAKFFASAAYEFIYPLTSELYHTNCRTTGIGFASAMSRIGGITMPWITMWALDISPTTTFVTFGIFCLIAATAVCMLPFDTAGRELDKVEE